MILSLTLAVNSLTSQGNVYLIQNCPAVKECAAPKKGIMKKDVKPKVAAKNWL